jgi:hypothetical protein
MWYIEYVRARRALTVYAIIVGLITAIALIVRINIHTHISRGPGAQMQTTIDSLAVIAGLAIAILGTVLATSLSNHVNGHLEIAWTKPIPRDRFVAQTFAIDIGALGVAYVISIAVLVAINAIYGAHLVYSLDKLGHVLAEFVFVVALYGLIQGVTSGMTRRSGMVAGLAWPILILTSGGIAARLPDVIHRVLVLINYLNPVALITARTEHGTITNALGIAAWSLPSLADAMLIFAIGLTFALVQWRRLEA